MGPTTIGLALLLALLVLVPTRRLALAGVQRPTLAAYFFGVWLLSLLVVLGGVNRLLIAVLLVAYVAPFVTLAAGFDALQRRMGRMGSRPIKDVTPPDEAPPPS